MTKLMLASGFIMLIAEWRQPTRWVPIVVLLGVFIATFLTLKWIFPLNAEMASHIKDATRLHGAERMDAAQSDTCRVVVHTVVCVGTVFRALDIP